MNMNQHPENTFPPKGSARRLLSMIGAVALGPMSSLAVTQTSVVTLSFAPPVDYPTGDRVLVGAEVVDLNRDGIPDLFTQRGVLLGQGDGTFPVYRMYHEQGPIELNALADFNRDGKLDLFKWNGVRPGRGDGRFGQRRPFDMGGGAPLAEDLNRDGKYDLVSYSGVRLGRGDGTFGDLMQLATVIDWTSAIVVRDLNLDGKPDLMGAACTDERFSVLLGKGNGRFSAAVESAFGTGSSQRCSITVAELNRDAKPDLVVIGIRDRQSILSILTGNGDGGFVQAGAYPVDGEIQSLVVADLNRDGKADVTTGGVDGGAVYNMGRTVSVWLGNGKGGLRAPVHYDRIEGLMFPNVAVKQADLNRDGKPDLIAAHTASDGEPSGVDFLLGKGPGTFADPVRVEAGAAPYDVVIADLNRDGKPDVVTANLLNSISVLINESP